MRVLYDGMIYAMQTAGGINRYFAKIIDGLPQEEQPTLMLKTQRDFNYPTHPSLRVIQKNYRFRPGRIARWMEKSYFRHMSSVRDFDIAHPTYYSLLTGRGMKDYRSPVVLTVYDMIHEIFADQLDSSQREVVEQKRHAIEAAQAILCISESTKRDLMERCGVSEHKITVTYLAADIECRMAYGPEPVPDRPYFLYVGNRAVYKNFDRLLLSMAQVLGRHSDLGLCVVGSPWSEKEQQRIAELRLSDRITLMRHTTDAHLAKLYRCSLAFVYPSLYEGFGIPPLEAMACDTVVIASDCSSIPEVVGDAGLLFDPYSTEALTEALRSVAEDSIDRAGLLERGRRQAEKFSWQRTAGQTYAVYQSLIA